MPRMLLLGLLTLCSGFATSPADAELVTEWIDYDHQGVALRGYLVYDAAQVSAESTAPGVLVIHEWWGLNAHIKGTADHFGRLGYRVAAIDLYDGKVATKGEDARKYIAGYKVPRELHVVDEVPRAPSGKPAYPQALEIALSGDCRVE